MLNLTEQKATLAELELLVAVRCRVLRAANQLPEDTPLPEVESQTRTYYQKAFAENTHTAYLLWDGETLAGTGAVSYFQVMPTGKSAGPSSMVDAANSTLQVSQWPF